MITRQILREDMSLFSSLQAGLEASGQQGVLGKCEERIHAFQKFLVQTMEAGGRGRRDGGVVSTEPGCGHAETPPTHPTNRAKAGLSP